MNGKKNIAITVGFVLAVSLIASSLTAILCWRHYSRVQFRLLGEVCQEILQQQPEAERAVAAALKICRTQVSQVQESGAEPQKNFLLAYGYQEGDFQWAGRGGWVPGAIGFLAGAAVFLLTLKARHRKETMRIQALTEYLENVNTGGRGLLLAAEEDAFSGLQDEIYKTVTALYQTRDAALRAKDNFAENLSNIAHQIKTPITSISLSVQMLKDYTAPEHLEQISQEFFPERQEQISRESSSEHLEQMGQQLSPERQEQISREFSSEHLEQISQQLSRLTRLEEALLLLSRIDAGTLPLEKAQVDVFTLLTLAGDNLQELFHRAQVSLHIPEAGAIAITADLEWTMEAVMNLLKNCLEHTPPGGRVSCAYEQNPLYTQIRIWDSGSGFAKEDLPRLFERFYRGRGAGSGGIGIGLSLAREIIERQNGTISARNLAEGGACFEIRMYSH